MIGPLEKGIQAAQVSRPISGTYEGVDLRVLPKYICFRAALLQNKLTLQYIVLILGAILLIHYASSRYEIYQLYSRLREKEYILAPGVQDFTPAHPHTVPDSYVANAVTDFLGQLGNVTASTIDEQYALLADAMSPQLKIRFLEESAEYKARVKSEGISELLSLTDKEIRTNGDGHFQVTALGRRDTYINHEYVGATDEVIEMALELVPPKSGKRWYLQINSLTRQSESTFRAKKKF